MSIRWGVSPIAWANDDMPELGGDTPLESILADIRDVGFEGVELGGKFPRNADELKPLLDSYGLSLIGGWYSGSLLIQDAEAEIEALQPHLALLKALGSTVFVFAETSNAIHGQKTKPLSGTPRLQADDWIVFGQRLTAVADYIQSQGLKFAYHHHLGTVVEKADDLDAFIASTGSSVGLTLDTGHAALGGVNSLAVIRDHPERVVHVHCKDVRWETYTKISRSGASFLDGVLSGMFTVPGDGGINYSEFLGALKAIDYSGWIVIEAEQDPAIANPRTYAQLGLNTLKTHARELELV